MLLPNMQAFDLLCKKKKKKKQIYLFYFMLYLVGIFSFYILVLFIDLITKLWNKLETDYIASDLLI